MKKSDAIKFFGSVVETANALGLSRQAVHQWGDDDDPVPIDKAIKIQDLSKGKVKVKMRLYENGAEK